MISTWCTFLEANQLSLYKRSEGRPTSVQKYQCYRCFYRKWWCRHDPCQAIYGIRPSSSGLYTKWAVVNNVIKQRTDVDKRNGTNDQNFLNDRKRSRIWVLFWGRMEIEFNDHVHMTVQAHWVMSTQGQSSALVNWFGIIQITWNSLGEFFLIP